MIIEQTFTVNAPQERTAEFFLDIDQVSSCVPGVGDVREVRPGTYEATLEVRLGPIRAAFKGTLTLDDAEAPKRLKARGEGRDRATGSTVKVDFTADLSEDQPGTTTVRAAADLAVRGRLSQFGTGVMRAAASEIVAEFATCADTKLASHDRGTAQTANEPPVSEPVGGAPRGIVSVVFRGLVRGLARVLRRAADRIEARLDGSAASK